MGRVGNALRESHRALDTLVQSFHHGSAAEALRLLQEPHHALFRVNAGEYLARVNHPVGGTPPRSDQNHLSSIQPCCLYPATPAAGCTWSLLDGNKGETG